MLDMDYLHTQIDEIYQRAIEAEEMSLALRCLELKFKFMKGGEVNNSDLCVGQMDEITLEKLISELESKN